MGRVIPQSKNHLLGEDQSVHHYPPSDYGLVLCIGSVSSLALGWCGDELSDSNLIQKLDGVAPLVADPPDAIPPPGKINPFHHTTSP